MMNERQAVFNSSFITPHSSFVSGGGKTRTCDLALIMRLLCHLSFATVCLTAEFGVEPKSLTSKASVLPVGRLRKEIEATTELGLVGVNYGTLLDGTSRSAYLLS
jgi:hypothetical protein